MNTSSDKQNLPSMVIRLAIREDPMCTNLYSRVGDNMRAATIYSGCDWKSIYLVPIKASWIMHSANFDSSIERFRPVAFQSLQIAQHSDAFLRTGGFSRPRETRTCFTKSSSVLCEPTGTPGEGGVQCDISTGFIKYAVYCTQCNVQL